MHSALITSNFVDQLAWYIKNRILHECSCFSDFIKRVGEKGDKMRGLSRNLSLFHNEFNKFNNTRARKLDSIYHMTLRLL